VDLPQAGGCIVIGICIPQKLWPALLVAALVMFSCLGTSSPASSRSWKPTKSAIAEDYAQIFDDRNKHEIILIWWLVPPMVPDSPETRRILDKYVVMALVHAEASADGTVSYDAIDSLQVTDSNGKPLKLLRGDGIPPDATKMLADFGKVARQAVGGMGHGMTFFVFEAGAVHACATGGLSAPFAGEDYTYKTPFPGCP